MHLMVQHTITATRKFQINGHTIASYSITNHTYVHTYPHTYRHTIDMLTCRTIHTTYIIRHSYIRTSMETNIETDIERDGETDGRTDGRRTDRGQSDRQTDGGRTNKQTASQAKQTNHRHTHRQLRVAPVDLEPCSTELTILLRNLSVGS